MYVWGGGCENIFENISFTGIMLNEFLGENDA